MKPLMFGVIGDPVAHSLSPRMHNAAFAAEGLPHLYLPFHVRRRELKTFMRHLARLGLAGINVTVPHKIDVIETLDQLDAEAKAIGAVNVVAIKDGKRMGYNTDGQGFVRAFHERFGVFPRRKNTLIFGAGGAARAVAFALARLDAGRMVIVNRKVAHADRLATDLKRCYPSLAIHPFALSDPRWDDEIKDIDLVIQATSRELTDAGPLPFNLHTLPKEALVCDLVYLPQSTHFIRRAKRRHLRTMDGLAMLVWQGALAFEIWLGRPAPITAMKQAVTRQISVA